MQEPLIIEKFLPGPMEDELKNVLLGFQFPWHFYPNTNAAELETQEGDAPQFVHGFIQNGKAFSPYATVPNAIMQHMGLDPALVIRAKANIVGRELSPLTHPAHTDDQAPHWVFIYYVNDSDGDTCLYDGDKIVHRITPKKGRGVIFDGQIRHASSSPVQTPFRCIFNFNLKRELDPSKLARFAVENESPKSPK